MLLLRISTALWRRVFRGELLRQYLYFRREGNFLEENCLVIAPGFSKYAEHLRKPVFLLRRYSFHTEHHMGVLLCGKSSS
jgi:hypothetical protein